MDVFGQQPRIKDNGEVDKDSPPRPAFAEGEINLSISRQSKKLCVDVVPQKSKVKPGLLNHFDFFDRFFENC